MSYIDLHIHTTASDGSDTPRQVVEKAAAKGLAAIAVTDHNSTDGIAEAMAAGEELGVEVVPGVEISVDHYGRDVHLLGYYIDPEAEPLRALIAENRALRDKRNEEMVAAMAEAGYPISMDELRETFPGAVLGRPHMAEFLIRKGILSSVEEGFRTILGSKGQFYRPQEYVSLGAAERAIRQSGGVASLAHLLDYHMTTMELNALMQRVRCCGISLVEAYYAENDEDEVQEVLDLGREWGMDVTGGSDYHGSFKKQDMGCANVPDWVLEDLKEYRDNDSI